MQKSCPESAADGSYLGCTYWPTPTANSVDLDTFGANFGVVVHNPSDATTTVTVEAAGLLEDQAAIPPGGLHSFTLPMDRGLQLSSGAALSRQVPGAAYRLTSTRPVAVYQFNPLEYRMGDGSDFSHYSYSNDSSLVLPEHGLGSHYLVLARATLGIHQLAGYQFIPGFFAVVGTRANTTVTITFSAHTQAGTTFPAYAPGDTATFTVGAGEVLQILSALPSECTGVEVEESSLEMFGTRYCDLGPSYDLTGTRITSSAPVAVFSGHECSFVPFDIWACDHLEEQLLPLKTWGREAMVGRTVPQSPGAAEPNVIRILSGAAGNRITLEPPQSVGSSLILDSGQWVEFQTAGDLLVTGDGPLQVAQFTIGENSYRPYGELTLGDETFRGDPAMALVAPAGQYRRSYHFLAPLSMTVNYINIIKPTGADSGAVWLDECRVLPEAFRPLSAGAAWAVARIPIAGGGHRVVADSPVGLLGYGFASYTSYMYPAGINLHTLCDVE